MMKKILLVVFLILPSLAFSNARPESKYDFPKIEITDINGNIVNPIKKKGNYLVSFWASWCTSCVTEIKNFTATEKQMNIKGVQLILINVDRNPKAIKKFFKKHKLPETTLTYRANMYDALQQFETTGLPITVAVKDKVVISKYIFLSMPWQSPKLIDNIVQPFKD